MIKKDSKEHNILYCKCGFKRVSGVDLSSRELNKKRLAEVGVNTEGTSEGVEFLCKKCGHKEADLFDLGERLNSESNLYLYKCRKCGTSARESDSGGKF